MWLSFRFQVSGGEAPKLRCTCRPHHPQHTHSDSKTSGDYRWFKHPDQPKKQNIRDLQIWIAEDWTPASLGSDAVIELGSSASLAKALRSEMCKKLSEIAGEKHTSTTALDYLFRVHCRSLDVQWWCWRKGMAAKANLPIVSIPVSTTPKLEQWQTGASLNDFASQHAGCKSPSLCPSPSDSEHLTLQNWSNSAWSRLAFHCFSIFLDVSDLYSSLERLISFNLGSFSALEHSELLGSLRHCRWLHQTSPIRAAKWYFVGGRWGKYRIQ